MASFYHTEYTTVCPVCDEYTTYCGSCVNNAGHPRSHDWQDGDAHHPVPRQGAVASMTCHNCAVVAENQLIGAAEVGAAG